MSSFTQKNKISLVFVIVPKHMRTSVVKLINSLGARNVVRITARGSQVQEGAWFTKIFPAPSPELESMQILVPDCHINHFFEKVIEVSKMNAAGQGLIYSIPCDEIDHSNNYPVWTASEEENSINLSNSDHSNNLSSIMCIIERGGADLMAKGAIHSGAHGPVVTFAEGRGVRDKIPLLRLTKTAEKEFVQVVVDDTDLDLVFSQMAKAGRITDPGRGFLYTTPVNKAYINLPGVKEETTHTASMQQLIAAMDELKGNRDWRKRENEEFDSKDKKNEPVFLENLVSLTCITPREQSDALIEAALEAGAPAASVGFGSIKDAESEKGADRNQVNKEWGFIHLAIAPDKVDFIKDAIKKRAVDSNISEVCFYVIPVSKALTYLG